MNVGYHDPSDDEAEPVNRRAYPTHTRSDAECQREADAMIADFESAKARNPMTYVGGLLTLLMVVGVPTVAVLLIVWMMNWMGFFDMIAARMP